MNNKKWKNKVASYAIGFFFNSCKWSVAKLADEVMIDDLKPKNRDSQMLRCTFLRDEL